MTVVRVENSTGMSLTFDSSRGAKISSLTASGKEFLAQPAGERTPSAGSSFTDAEMSGWDECAPSIEACRLDAHSIPDHGDLWDASFHVVGDVVRAHGSSYPYRFERAITPTRRGFRLDYRASSLMGALPFLWAAHPQFLAPPGTRVGLVDIDFVRDVRDGERLARWQDVASIDSVAEGACRKFYVPPHRPVSEAHLIRPDAVLTLRWSAECPYLGLWFDNRAFSREPVIAIEPSTGYFDSLERAVSRSCVSRLPPGDGLKWSVEIDIAVG